MLWEFESLFAHQNKIKVNNYTTLLELFFDQYEKQDKNNIFLINLGNPKHKLSWEKTYLLVNHLSNQISKDIKLGDRCVLISENRPEWLISDLAIMLAGGISVPSYTTYTTKDYEYIIKDCEPSVIIVSNNIQFNKIKNILDYKKIKKIISFDRIENLKFQNYLCIEDIINKKDGFENFNSEITLKRSDPACIIYTSGTQGNPKGVILSHGGILSNCEGGLWVTKINHIERYEIFDMVAIITFLWTHGTIHTNCCRCKSILRREYRQIAQKY